VACVEIPFSYGGVHGVVDARCAPMADPEAFGKSRGDLGLPACTAVVRFPALGYWSLLGWVQLVAMGPPHQPEEWRSDPFDLFEDSTSPYAWFGVTPTLFDAPSRRHGTSLRWRARSFLATTPWDQDERLVAPLAGFEWGYDLDPTGAVVVRHPVELPSTVWQTHLTYLRARFDRWAFLGDSGATDG
jgi:hypothetical protein